jgi:hypothetical protein
MGKTLRYVRERHPGVHVVFQDLDVLPLSSAWFAHTFARPFTLAAVTRPPNIYAALNCGLLLFHRRRLEQAAAFLDLALWLYRRRPLLYFQLHRRVPGHACCAQHVLQHGLELVLGSNQWQRYSPSLTFHSRQPDSSSSGLQTTQNTTCLDAFPGVADSFVLLSLPLREYLPSSSNSSSSTDRVMSSQPVPHSKMIHYKGGWKQAHMARDFRTSLRFDFRAGLHQEDRFRLLIAQTYGLNFSSSASSSACSLPCCDPQQACQQPALVAPLAQCHRQLFKYKWIEQYYLQKREPNS